MLYRIDVLVGASWPTHKHFSAGIGGQGCPGLARQPTAPEIRPARPPRGECAALQQQQKQAPAHVVSDIKRRI